MGDTGPRRRVTPDGFDPIVGGRSTANLSDRVGSRLTRWAELQVQVKVLDVDYQEGVGRDFYAYDVVSPGVVIAFSIHF